MQRKSFSKMFNADRKVLYMIVFVTIISIFTLTIVYAALSTTLKITGNTEVVASSWDIYLDNVQLMNGSVTTNVPIITDNTTATFTTTLTNPGDYYMFTIDVVNNGSMDAMIDSIEKLPQLSESQAKYLNYIVEYQNGESINTKQLVKANSFVRFKVKVEFRKDIVSSDLPITSETLNLSFKVNYVQAEESGNTSVENAGKLVKVVSGDYDTVGSEICIDTECFYVISSDDTSVTMLSKYNLYVGGKYEKNVWTPYGDEATGIQEETMLGYSSDEQPCNGTISFSLTNYWSGLTDSYPIYVYDSNSNLYPFVQNYKDYLESLGVNIVESRLIKQEELVDLECSPSGWDCSRSKYSWVYSTSYWTGSAFNSERVWREVGYGGFGTNEYELTFRLGVRPVITISKSEF